MPDNYSRLLTSAEVYAVIMAKHREQMSCFASFSDPDGTFNGGPGVEGRMETVWGIAGTDYPLLEIRTSWKINPNATYARLEEKHSYFLLCAQRADE